MVTERNYAVRWLNMFREWIPKSRDSNWKNERSILGLGARETWKIDMMVLQNNEFDRQWSRVWRWCMIEQGASEEISEVGQNGKIEETVWQPWLSSSEYIEVLEYP